MKTQVELPEERVTMQDYGSLIVKAETRPRRLKLFVWGESGVGKTILALHFPKPVVIDLEGGTDLYGDEFSFHVVKLSTADEVMGFVDWLLRNEHPYRTLVIDPVTVYEQLLQRKWSDIFLQRKKGSRGFKHEFYEFQPRDFMTINAERNELVNKLVALDMNLVVTARNKIKYRDGAFMVAEGETWDGHRSLVFPIDVRLHMYYDATGRRMAVQEKDRTNRLPSGEFECLYEVIEAAFGKKELHRKAKPIEYATAEQIQTISDHIGRLGLPTEKVMARLAAYDADSLDSLTKENAALIIQKLEANGGNGNAKTTKG